MFRMKMLNLRVDIFHCNGFNKKEKNEKCFNHRFISC